MHMTWVLDSKSSEIITSYKLLVIDQIIYAEQSKYDITLTDNIKPSVVLTKNCNEGINDVWWCIGLAIFLGFV